MPHVGQWHSVKGRCIECTKCQAAAVAQPCVALRPHVSREGAATGAWELCH